MIRGRVYGSKQGWWSGVGFVSVGFGKILRRVDSVRTTMEDIFDTENINPRSEG